MKILHVIAQLPDKTGSGVYFGNIIKGLQVYGHKQQAVFAVQDDYTFDLLPASRQYPVRFKTPELPFPIPGMSDIMPYESTIYSHMDSQMMRQWRQAFSSALRQAEREFQPEVVVLHHLWILTSLALNIFQSAACIAICHNTDLRQAEENPNIKRTYVSNLGRLTAILTLSRAQQPKICQLHGCDSNKIIVVGGGYDEHLFSFPDNKQPGSVVRILYAGKIAPSKGVFELVRAFKDLCRLKDDLCLNIVGTPPPAYVSLLADMTEGHDNICLYPSMSQKSLAGFMQEQDVFVLPSYYEGLGLIAIESLASGLWTVATENEGLMSLLGERIRASGVIEYVNLPPLVGLDTPSEGSLDVFVERLAAKLLLQVERVEQRKNFPADIWPEIKKYSWKSVVERVQQTIMNMKVLHDSFV